MANFTSRITQTLIATLGSEPQVITSTLDLLLQAGEKIDRVVVIHTDDTRSPIMESVAALRQVVQNSPYYGKIAFRFVSILDPQGRPLQDVETSDAIRAAFVILYRQMRSAKHNNQNVHLCIVGGRKTLALFGMAAAQLLFDENDHIWHLFSGGEFLASKRLHPEPDDEVHLISIPIIQWSQVPPVITALSDVEDPFEAADRVRQIQLAERLEQARSFLLGSLKEAERRVVAPLVEEGLSDFEIAERLSLSPRTVEQHLRAAYQKAAAHWEMEAVTRTHLIALLNLYYALKNTGNPA